MISIEYRVPTVSRCRQFVLFGLDVACHLVTLMVSVCTKNYGSRSQIGIKSRLSHWSMISWHGDITMTYKNELAHHTNLLWESIGERQIPLTKDQKWGIDTQSRWSWFKTSWPSHYVILIIMMTISVKYVKFTECTLCAVSRCRYMMTSSNGNIFRVTGHLCGEFTGPRWILHTKASEAEFWCFLWSASE